MMVFYKTMIILLNHIYSMWERLIDYMKKQFYLHILLSTQLIFTGTTLGKGNISNMKKALF